MYNNIEVYMYSSPFGSIFGNEDEVKLVPKLKAQPKEESEAEKAPVSAVAKKVVSTSDLKNKRRDKKPFSVVPPQFRVTTTMRSDDPRVISEQAKISVEKNKQKLEALNRYLKDLLNKTKSAKIYRDVLTQYRQLSDSDKAEIDTWIIKNSSSIKKLGAARKLQKIDKNTKEAVKALDAEIKHWENLLKLKNSGVNLRDKTILKTFRPSVKRIPATPVPRNEVPKFKTKTDMRNIIGLKDNKISVRAHELGTYTEKFIEKLPGRDVIMQKRTSKTALPRMVKKTEKTIVMAKQLEWRIGMLEDKILAERKLYNKVKKTLKQLTSAMTSDPKTSGIVNAFGILLEAKPERFLSSATLFEAVKSSFKNLSQLGGFGAEPEASFLDVTAESSKASLKELELRQNTLAQLKAKVEDKPTPTPIILVVSSTEDKTKDTFSINKLLPWIAAGLLFMKLLES